MPHDDNSREKVDNQVNDCKPELSQDEQVNNQGNVDDLISDDGKRAEEQIDPFDVCHFVDGFCCNTKNLTQLLLRKVVCFLDARSIDIYLGRGGGWVNLKTTYLEKCNKTKNREAHTAIGPESLEPPSLLGFQAVCIHSWLTKALNFPSFLMIKLKQN